MEKSERRKTAPGCGGLLKNLPRFCAFLFLGAICAFPLCAFEVDIFVSSFEILPGQEMTLEFTVYGASPSDTSVENPSFPKSFMQTSSRKERRRVERKGSLAGNSADATVISQKWIPSEAGNFSLGPFTVKVKGEKVELPPVYITVTAPPAAEFTGLRWETAPEQGRVGKPLRITLEACLKGTVGAVSCDAPENALLEPVSLPVSASGTGAKGAQNSAGEDSRSSDGNPAWVPVAAWKWTPLSSGECQLPIAVLEYTTPAGKTLKIASQPYSVTVAPGSPEFAESRNPQTVGKAFASPLPEKTGDTGVKQARSVSAFPVPDVSGTKYSAITVAADFWRKGSYREALAALRHAEYTTLFPRAYRAVRLACEDSLGLGETLPVPPAAWKPFAVIGAVVLLFLGLALYLVGTRLRVSRQFPNVLLFASAALAIFAVFVYTRDLKPAGVISRSSLLHVPETSSTVVEILPEGTAIRILRKAGDWAYVETPSSLRGWIRGGQVVEYTKTERQ